MSWQLELIRHTVATRIPFGHQLRRIKRRAFGYPPSPSNVRSTIDNFRHMQAVLAGMGRSFDGATVLEIGSGWFPTIPILLTVTAGAERVIMTDLNVHMDAVTFRTTIRFLQNQFPDDSRFQNIESVTDLPIEYLAPFDERNVKDGSLDYVVSRTVLEHIPPHDLENLLAALRRKLKPNGLMVHIIDNSDHLEHSDKKLSKVNFLTWSDRKHALFNRLQQGGENRLRHHEYPALFRRAGLKVVFEEADVHEPTRERVASLPLAPRYAGMTPEQIAILTSTYALAAD